MSIKLTNPDTQVKTNAFRHYLRKTETVRALREGPLREIERMGISEYLLSEVAECKCTYPKDKKRGEIMRKENKSFFTGMTRNSGFHYQISAFYANKKEIAKAFVALYPFFTTADCLVKNYSATELIMLDLFYLMACDATNNITYEL